MMRTTIFAIGLVFLSLSLFSSTRVNAADTFYSDKSKIPAGLWCYTASERYVCENSQTACVSSAGTTGTCVSSSEIAAPTIPQKTTGTDIVLPELQVNAQAPVITNSGFTPIAPIPGLTQGVPANTAGIAAFLNNLYIYLIGVAAFLAVIMIVWGGLEYSLQDSIAAKGDGKKKIYDALFGLVLVLSPALVFYIINPAILNLNISMPALQTGWRDYNPGSINPADIVPPQSDLHRLPTGEFGTNEKIIACGNASTCNAAIATCAAGKQASQIVKTTGIQCRKTDGTIDPNGRSDSWYYPTIIQGISCIPEDTMTISCQYLQMGNF